MRLGELRVGGRVHELGQVGAGGSEEAGDDLARPPADGPAVGDDLLAAAGVAEEHPPAVLVRLRVGEPRVEDRLEVTNPEPEARYYTVAKGDTLSKIAKQHYDDANKYPQIFEANKPMLKDPDKIYPGQSLRIPELH